MGLDLERFGLTTMLVRAVPAALGKTDAPGLLADLSPEIAELGGPMSLRDKLDQVAATIACHGSVRAGRVLSVAEMGVPTYSTPVAAGGVLFIATHNRIYALR